MFPNSSAAQQTSLRPHRVGELLPARHRLAADLAGRVDGVLVRERAGDIADGDAELASVSGLTQKRIAYWPAPKIGTWPMPGTRVIGSLMLM